MKYIIPMIVGSIIGYFTNWLAIKMLFRPHNEKRILGIRLPFTPGLIPKERFRISNNIGKAVGEHLLTPKKISQVLSSEETSQNINKWINKNLEELKKQEKSLNDLIKNIDFDLKIIEKSKEKFVELVVKKFRSDSFRKTFIDYLEFEIYDRYKEEALENLNLQGRNLISNILKSEKARDFIVIEIKSSIESLMKEDKRLKQLLSKESLERLENLLEENRDLITSTVKEFFQDPDLKLKLKKSIEDLIDKNVSKLITMFIDPEMISDKVFNIIEGYVNSDDADEIIIFTLRKSLKQVLDIEISTLLEKATDILGEDSLIKSVDLILLECNKLENLDKIIKTLDNYISHHDLEIKESLLNWVSGVLDENLESMEFENSISKIVDGFVARISHRPISIILKDIDASSMEEVTNIVRMSFEEFGDKVLLDIIKIFDISKIVEEQINSFDVEYTEKLIIDIAEKELNAITRLGALLGAIMGLLSPILQMLV